MYGIPLQLVIYLITGKRIPLINLFLPFTTPDGIGFWINQIAFTLCMPLIYYLNTFVGVYIPLSMHTIAMVNVISKLIDDTKDNVDKVQKSVDVKKKFDSNLNVNESVDEMLVKLINIQKDYENFKSIFLSYSITTTFFEATVNSFGIGLSIAYIYFISIPLGTTLLFMHVVQLAIFCSVGVLIENQNERLLSKVIDFPWIELKQKNKKIFLQLIHVCQNSLNLEVPIYGVVNLTTFTATIDAGYDFFNYLINFVK
jgi:hypothetical protein